MKRFWIALTVFLLPWAGWADDSTLDVHWKASLPITADGNYTSKPLKFKGGCGEFLVQGTFDSATVTLQYSVDNSNWFSMDDTAGNAIAKTAAADKVQFCAGEVWIRINVNDGGASLSLSQVGITYISRQASVGIGGGAAGGTHPVALASDVSGTLKHENGGLEADVSAWDYGMLGVNGFGTTVLIDTSAEIANILGADRTGGGVMVFAVSPSLTGNVDMGSAVSVEIPNAASPTVNAAGEIAEDTTNNDLLWGAAPNVLAAEICDARVVENAAAADDNIEFWMHRRAVTITAVGCHCRGTCSTPAQFSLEDRAGNAMTHTTPTCSTGTGATTYQSVTAAGGLSAGEGVAFDVDNTPSPETDEYTVAFCYTIDRT